LGTSIAESEAAMISCRREPHRGLSPFVADLWLYDGYVSAHARERILPSGTFELVLNLRENEIRIYDGAQPARCRRYSGAVISGPYASYFGSDAIEEVSIMGVHFRPGGAFPFLGFSAGDLASDHVNLAEIWKGHAEDLRAQLAEATSTAQRFRLLEQALIDHLQRPLQRHPAVATALAAHERCTASMRTRELARVVGLSERRFIDVFRAEVGTSPKLFDRIQRFQRVLAQTRVADVVDWAALAAACGYYDQSHLIRDFSQFTGITPTNFLARMKALRSRGAHAKPNHLAFAD
jgi:AraC-like DNA-binding protein